MAKYRVVEIHSSITPDVFKIRRRFQSDSLDECWNYVEQLLTVRERGCIVGDSIFVWDDRGYYMDPPQRIGTLYRNNLEPV